MLYVCERTPHLCRSSEDSQTSCPRADASALLFVAAVALKYGWCISASVTARAEGRLAPCRVKNTAAAAACSFRPSALPSQARYWMHQLHTHWPCLCTKALLLAKGASCTRCVSDRECIRAFRGLSLLEKLVGNLFVYEGSVLTPAATVSTQRVQVHTVCVRNGWAADSCLRGSPPIWTLCVVVAAVIWWVCCFVLLRQAWDWQ